MCSGSLLGGRVEILACGACCASGGVVGGTVGGAAGRAADAGKGAGKAAGKAAGKGAVMLLLQLGHGPLTPAMAAGT